MASSFTSLIATPSFNCDSIVPPTSHHPDGPRHQGLYFRPKYHRLAAGWASILLPFVPWRYQLRPCLILFQASPTKSYLLEDYSYCWDVASSGVPGTVEPCYMGLPKQTGWKTALQQVSDPRNRPSWHLAASPERDPCCGLTTLPIQPARTGRDAAAIEPRKPFMGCKYN